LIVLCYTNNNKADKINYSPYNAINDIKSLINLDNGYEKLKSYGK